MFLYILGAQVFNESKFCPSECSCAVSVKLFVLVASDTTGLVSHPFAVAKQKKNFLREYNSYEPGLEIEQKQSKKERLEGLVRTLSLKRKNSKVPGVLFVLFLFLVLFSRKRL